MLKFAEFDPYGHSASFANLTNHFLWVDDVKNMCYPRLLAINYLIYLTISKNQPRLKIDCER
jgi:hypothetical protein